MLYVVMGKLKNESIKIDYKTKVEPQRKRDLRFMCIRSDIYVVRDVAVASDGYNSRQGAQRQSLETWHSGYSRSGGVKFSSWHSRIAAKGWCIYVQLGRNDVQNIV